MHCPSCGADVGPGQRFCMDCGAALTASTQPTALVGPPTGPMRDDSTVRVPAVAAVTTAPVPQQRGESSTEELHAMPKGATRLDRTDELPTRATARTDPSPVGAGRQFRFRPLLLVAILAAGAAAVAVLTTLIRIESQEGQQAFEVGAWMVNDFGTNNAVAGLLAAGAMVVGGLVWGAGYRWGAGLAGGAGAALAGWSALLVGLAEWPVANAEAAAAVVPSTITRDVGWFALIVAGGLGLLALVASLAGGSSDGRAGLDPWVAAIAAVSVLVAAGGPLIPEGTADWTGNYSSRTLGVDLPALFFIGRGVQLGLLAVCGVVGFLLVRRYGLGLAIGASITAGWLVVTAASGQTSSPIGPGFANPGAGDLSPHAVTIVGMAMLGFFALVAVVMALLDSDR